MVMDSNGEECTLRDYDLVCDSPVGWKLINLVTGPEVVRLFWMTYALPQFYEAQALRTFPSLKFASPGRITDVIDEVKGNDALRRVRGSPRLETLPTCAESFCWVERPCPQLDSDWLGLPFDANCDDFYVVIHTVLH